MTTTTERARPLANYPFARKVAGLIFLSGVSARLPDGGMAGVRLHADGRRSYDAGAQLDRIMENIAATLAEQGAAVGDLVDLTVYLTDMADYPSMNAAYNRHFGPDGPARTTVGVRALPHPDMVVEVKAVAVDPTAGK